MAFGRALALGFSLRPRFMFCMRALAFLPKWLVIARPPRPVVWAERRVLVLLPGPVLGNSSACAVPIRIKQTASAADKAARIEDKCRNGTPIGAVRNGRGRERSG